MCKWQNKGAKNHPRDQINDIQIEVLNDKKYFAKTTNYKAVYKFSNV